MSSLRQGAEEGNVYISDVLSGKKLKRLFFIPWSRLAQSQQSASCGCSECMAFTSWYQSEDEEFYLQLNILMPLKDVGLPSASNLFRVRLPFFRYSKTKPHEFFSVSSPFTPSSPGFHSLHPVVLSVVCWSASSLTFYFQWNYYTASTHVQTILFFSL